MASALIDKIRQAPELLTDDLQEVQVDDIRGSADLLFRGTAGKLHLVYVRESPTPELIHEIGARVRSLRERGELAAGWLVSTKVTPDIDDLAIVERIQTRSIDTRAHPDERAPRRPRLRGRHGLRTSIAEDVALAQLTPSVRALVRDLEHRGYEVRHGEMQTHLIYRGQGIGGISRHGAHGYFSKTLETEELLIEFDRLGVEAGDMGRTSGAFAGHRWYGIDLATGLDRFVEAIRAVERVVDEELRLRRGGTPA
jgi:hypothetical protein